MYCGKKRRKEIVYVGSKPNCTAAVDFIILQIISREEICNPGAKNNVSKGFYRPANPVFPAYWELESVNLVIQG